jgi:hypothetical protein
MGDYFFLIVAVPVIGFLGLLMWAAQRGRPVEGPGGTLVFRHGLLLRGFAMVMAFGIPLGITILVLFNPPKKEGDLTAIVCLYALFGVLSAPLLWEAMRFSLTVSPEGLDCRSPWRGHRFLPWEEVKEVSYNATNSWFVIRARDGWKFRPSILVPGLAKFLEACERRLPLSALANAEEGYRRVRRPFPREEIEAPDSVSQAQVALDQWKRRNAPRE